MYSAWRRSFSLSLSAMTIVFVLIVVSAVAFITTSNASAAGECREGIPEKTCTSMQCNAGVITNGCPDNDKVGDPIRLLRDRTSDWKDAGWFKDTAGGTVVYQGDEYHHSLHKNVNGEIWAKIDGSTATENIPHTDIRFGDRGNAGESNRWSYYVLNENSSCRDTLAFPPQYRKAGSEAVSGETRNNGKKLNAIWYKVDTVTRVTKVKRGCEVVDQKTIEIYSPSYLKKVAEERIGTQRAAAEQQHRRDLKGDRKELMESNIDLACKNEDTSKANNCKNALRQAFESCYSSLGGGSDGSEKPIDAKDLQDCIQEKSGYSDMVVASLFVHINESAVTRKCEVSGIGWVVCWVSRFIAKLVDGLYKVLEILLVTPPLDESKPSGQKVYEVWSIFRNIANIIFVIAMLVVILSQITNIGISNYGIKTLLPRIIIGAILINASYVICAIIIDLTNVFGGGIRAVFDQAVDLLRVSPQIEWLSWDSALSIALLVGAGISIYMSILSFPALLISAMFALFMTVVILTARLVIIIMLVAISPFAFAANIFPNTQSWFKKWWSTFIIACSLYPVIGFIFSFSQLAAGVIAAGIPNTSSDSAGLTLLFTLFALAVQFIPFFLVPLLLKISGGLIEKVAGIANNTSKGLVDRAKNRSGRWTKNKEANREINAINSNSKGLYARVKRRQNMKGQVAKRHKEQLSSVGSGAFGNLMAENEDKVARDVAYGGRLGELTSRATNKLPGGDERQQQRDQDEKNAKSMLDNVRTSIDIEEINAAEAWLEDNNYSRADLKNVADGVGRDGNQVTESEKAAALRKLAATGNIEDVHKLIQKYTKGTADLKALDALTRGIASNNKVSSAAHFNNSTLGQLRTGGYNRPAPTPSSNASGHQQHNVISSMMRDSAPRFSSPAILASQSPETLKELKKAMATFSEDQKNGIRGARDNINHDDHLRNTVSVKSRNGMNIL